MGPQHCPIKILYLCWRQCHQTFYSSEAQDTGFKGQLALKLPWLQTVMLSQDGKPCGKDSKSSLCFDADLISYNASISACSSDPTHIAAEPENGHESWWLSHILMYLNQSHQTLSNHTWTHPFFEGPVNKECQRSHDHSKVELPSSSLYSFDCPLSLSLSLCLSIYISLFDASYSFKVFVPSTGFAKTPGCARVYRSSELLAGRTCPCPICFVILCNPDTASEIMYLHSHISTHQKSF